MWVTIQLSFLWHGWAFPNHFKIINEQSIQKTRWRVIWNHLSVSLSVGQVNISVRSRGIIFPDFFHKLMEPKFCRKFVFVHIWAKSVPKLGKSLFYWKFFYLISLDNFSVFAQKDNHCDSSLLMPNSITGKILGFELLPKILSKDQIIGLLKVFLKNELKYEVDFVCVARHHRRNKSIRLCLAL